MAGAGPVAAEDAAAVRAAGPDDVRALAAMFAVAFEDYPWTRWIVDAGDHARRLHGLYEIHLDVAVRFGEVWMAADAAGAAAWTWSGSAAEQADHMGRAGLEARAAELAGDHGERVALAERLLSPFALREPHWHLQALGVLPERRNQGLGARLLQPVLQRCDAEGRPAALETSAPDNVRLYRRLGFRVRGEVDMPGGPRVWLMSRAPGAAALG